jgi:hypothetical protein
MKRLLGITVSMAVLAVSCTMWDTADYEGALKGLALMTPIAENEENTLSKATLPLWSGGALSDAINVSGLAVNDYINGSISNYPEKLQTTTYKVTNKGNRVYFIETVTTYSGNSNREVTYENYYLLSSDTTLTNADPICKADGTVDPLYRDKFETTFGLSGPKNERVSNVRKEIITNTKYSSNPVSYASFANVDPNSLRVLGTLNYVPTTDSSAQYSSRVTYTQSLTKEDATTIGLDYYLGTVTAIKVTGTRYYTEIKKDNITECSALYIEDFKDDTGALMGRTATKYWYTIDSSGKRSNKTVVGTSVFKTKNGNKVMDL